MTIARRAAFRSSVVVVFLSFLALSGTARASVPTADFSWSPTVPLVDQTAAFTASASATTSGATISSYSWSFGATTAEASTSFSSGGIKNVSLKVTDSNGESTTVAHNIRVNAPPTPSFGWSPAVPNATGQPSDTATFDASGSSDDQSGLSYAWTFGDGGTAGNVQKPTHSYATGGDRTVKLTVTDSDGVPRSQTRTVHVNSTPTAGFVCAGFDPTGTSASVPSQAFVNQQVACYGGPPAGGQPGSSDPDGNGTITGFAWDLGVGTFDPPSTSNSVIKNPGFPTAGAKTFRLKVTDANDATSPAASATITVVDRPPAVTFSFDPQTPKTGETVAFAATATDPDGAADVASIAWDLGSGAFTDAAGPTASARYASAGDYHVRVRVTDRSGQTATSERVVAVRDTRPDAAFTYTPAAPRAGQAIALTSTSTATPGRTLTALEWDVDGDGTFGDVIGPNVSVTFLNAGAHTVSLRATEEGGGIDIVSEVIMVADPAAQGVAGTSAGGFSGVAPLAGAATVGRALSVVSGVRVQVSGSVTIRGTRIARLVVTAPSGATVRVTCVGGGCPKKAQRAKAGRRPLRFRRLERTFQPGTRITVLVTKKGLIGKQVIVPHPSVPLARAHRAVPHARRPHGEEVSSDMTGPAAVLAATATCALSFGAAYAVGVASRDDVRAASRPLVRDLEPRTRVTAFVPGASLPGLRVVAVASPPATARRTPARAIASSAPAAHPAARRQTVAPRRGPAVAPAPQRVSAPARVPTPAAAPVRRPSATPATAAPKPATTFFSDDG